MNERVQELLSRAGIAFNNEQYEESLELCNNAIAEDPSNTEAYSGAGNICLVINRLDEAEKFLQKAAELDPMTGERYFNLANAKFALGKYTESLANYAKAEQNGCNDVILHKLYYQMGLINYINKDIKSSLINFEKADNLGVINADSKDILIKRLQIYIEAEDYLAAENCAIQLKLIAPDEFRSYQLYFQILVALRKFDKAELLIDEAEKYASDIDLDIRNRVDMCFNKALIFASKAEGEPDKLVEYYQNAISVFDDFLNTPDLPQDAVVNITLSKADIYLKLNKLDEALACTERLVVDENLQEKVNFIKLSCYLSKEVFEKAIDFAEQLKMSENLYYVYFANYADAFIAQKLSEKDANSRKLAEAKYNNAIAFFKNKAFENPQDVFALIFRIRLYAENGKYAKAEELIRILPDMLKTELNKYVSECKNER